MRFKEKCLIRNKEYFGSFADKGDYAMIAQMLDKKEKKVEYTELIYDLIFVYIIGRNNTLLHHTHGGFIDISTFATYVFVTLAVIQIWTHTTYYINLHGRNGISDHIFMFINMFALYFMAEGTRTDWERYHTQYHIAWAIILVNVAIQYIIEARNHRGEDFHISRIKRMAVILFSEALIVITSIFEYIKFETNFLSFAAIIFGIVAVLVSSRKACAAAVDFSHLSERIMLYVVFTFGEMIIAIASYFEGKLSFSSLYFSLMAFLIVTGLFLSYGAFYDHIVDRELNIHGLGYIFIHVFIIFFLNLITVSLEFMRNDEINLMPKLLMLIGSITFYYVFLYLLGIYAKKECAINKYFYISMGIFAVLFIALMLIFRKMMMLNIAITAIYIFSVFFILHHFANKTKAETKTN